MTADFFYQQQQQQQGRQRNEDEAYNMALLDIDLLLESYGKSLSDFDEMPLPSAPVVFNEPSLIDQELSQYDPELLRRQFENSLTQLNQEQRAVCEAVRLAIEQNDNARTTAKMFFLDGPGGTGKTFLHNVILSFVRSQSKKALSVASSGIAALLLCGGSTVHSRFGVPLHNLHAQSSCGMPVQCAKAQLIRRSTIIIWDEAPMAHKYAIEAVDRLLRDIMATENDDL